MATKPEFKIITVRGKTTYAVTIPKSSDPVLDVRLLDMARYMFRTLSDEATTLRILAEQEKLIPGSSPTLENYKKTNPGSSLNFIGRGELIHATKNEEVVPEDKSTGRSSVRIKLKTKPNYWQAILVDGYSSKIYWRCKHRHKGATTADVCADEEAIRRSKSTRTHSTRS